MAQHGSSRTSDVKGMVGGLPRGSRVKGVEGWQEEIAVAVSGLAQRVSSFHRSIQGIYLVAFAGLSVSSGGGISS